MSGTKEVWIPWQDRKQRTVKRPHNFSRKILHWPYCSQCGLLKLKNEATLRAIRAQCETTEDA